MSDTCKTVCWEKLPKRKALHILCALVHFIYFFYYMSSTAFFFSFSSTLFYICNLWDFRAKIYYTFWHNFCVKLLCNDMNGNLIHLFWHKFEWNLQHISSGKQRRHEKVSRERNANKKFKAQYKYKRERDIETFAMQFSIKKYLP
jgi:hypothetical protein